MNGAPNEIARGESNSMNGAENRCELGVPGPMRDRLVDAVLRGEKTATSSLLAEWTHEGEPLSEVGERSTVVDSGGQPVAVIELRGIDVLRLGDVGLGVARAEGEGFGTVDEWRRAHEQFWHEHVLPELPDELTSVIDDDTLVVVEHFSVMHAVDH